MPPSALTILPPSTGMSEVAARALLPELAAGEPLDELPQAAAVRPMATAAPPTPAARSTVLRLEPQWLEPQQASVVSAVCCSVVSRAIRDFLHEKSDVGRQRIHADRPTLSRCPEKRMSSRGGS